MKTLVLAAGRSRRVKPIEDKNFLKFAGKTLIEHQLDTLVRTGLDDIIIVAGAHNIEKLSEIALKYSAKIVEQKNLDEGMSGAVLATEELIKDETLLIMSSNDVLGKQAFESMQKAAKSDSDAYLLAYEVDTYFPGGYLQLDGDKITNIIEKPGEGNEPSNYVNVVLHMYKNPSTLFDALKTSDSDEDDRYEVAIDKLMKELTFEAVRYDGFWQPVKFPWHILDLMQFSFKIMGSRIADDAEVSDKAIINGSVIIESGAKIFDNALIQGPAYIGKNSVVATNALVRESMIGDNCVVGFSSEIARSFVGDDCWFHSNYVGDTVMGNNNSFGAGAVCANLRLDEADIGISKRNKLGPVLGDNIRVGVNTSIMPGIKIGSNTMITSGIVIGEDIDAKKFVNGKYQLFIKDNRATLDENAREEMKKKL